MNMTGYTVKIVNNLSQTVFNAPMNQQLFNVDLTTWTGAGIYYLVILDSFGKTIETKKIILQ
jgi:hypothetical protein